MFRTPSAFFTGCLLVVSLFTACQKGDEKKDLIEVMIWSGRNNHNWEHTTDLLEEIFRSAGRFNVKVTERPDTLAPGDLKSHHVIVSNWNSWPENDLRWPAALEAGILDFIRDGGGMVFFHASTSAFYRWPAFREISTASWQDQTRHGPKCPVQVEITDPAHPVTAGMSGFMIFDELWVNAGKNETFRVLGTAAKVGEDSLADETHARSSGEGSSGNGSAPQPAIFVKEYGEGRIFHTILGHDTRTMLNTGFRTLMLRGTEWAATGKASIRVPQELKARDEISGASMLAGDFSWFRSDSSFGLRQGDAIRWQFNQGTRHGKPFYHPIHLNGERITCLSPVDHPWHLGQWFSWKFIGGLNYWEFDRKRFVSEGLTEVSLADYTTNPDHSAEIRLELLYRARGRDPVLKEHRVIRVAAPAYGRQVMDYRMRFIPLKSEVELSRTPIEGEPDGKSWGGYAGLSLRFNQDFTDPVWLAETGEDFNPRGGGGRWLYMGFRGLQGERVGTAIFVAGNTVREGSGWYLINRPDVPFYYFSPAHLYHKPLTLFAGDTLELEYRVMHLSGDVNRESLTAAYREYAQSTNR